MSWKDTGWAKIKKQVAAGDKRVVKVGVLQGKGAEEDRDGVSMAELAAIHEYGAPKANIPERSFIRRTFGGDTAEMNQVVRGLARQVMAGRMDVDRALGLLGAWGATAVKNTITRGAGVPPPNAPSTVARKGSSRPLVDTGRLVDSITWEVE